MIKQTKTLTFVFAFAALMLAWPLTATEAFADGSTSSLNLECGVTTPGTIDFGAFSLGTSPDQETFTMTKLGGEIGTFDVVATDWTGVAQKSTGAILVSNPAVGNQVTINGITHTVSADTDSGALFQLDTTDAGTAVKLAASINANGDTGTVAHDVTAVAVGTTVLLKSSVAAALGNTIAVSQSIGTGTLTPTAATLLNGEDAGVVHMLASRTHYTVTVDGSDSSTENYATKKALAATGVDLSLAPQTQATTDLKMSLQIETTAATMLALPYNGALSQTLTFTSLCNQAP